MMKKIALLSLALALLLAACAPQVRLLPLPSPTPDPAGFTPTPRPTPTPTPTPDPNRQLGVGVDALQGVTVMLWHGLGGSEASLVAQLAAEFSLSNPWGISVEAVPQANFAGLVDAVDASFNQSDSPDLVIGLSEHALRWDAGGRVLELSPYVDNPIFGLPPADLADIPDVFLSQDVLADRRVAFPMLRSGRYVFYNQAWARELGFDAPPSTAEEFRRQACAANAAFRADTDPANDGLGGWVVDGDPYTAYGWLLAFDGNVYQNNTYTFNQPANLQALTYLKELRDQGCAWVSNSSSNYDHLVNRTALFVTGSLADVPELENTFRAAESTDSWTTLAFPGDAPVVPAYGPSFILMKSSQPRQLAAWLFVRWMLSPEIQARLAEQTGWLPVRATAIDLIPGYRQQHPQWAVAAELIPQMQGHPQAASWRTTRLVLGDGFYYIFQLNLPVADLPGVLQLMDDTAAELHP